MKHERKKMEYQNSDKSSVATALNNSLSPNKDKELRFKNITFIPINLHNQKTRNIKIDLPRKDNNILKYDLHPFPNPSNNLSVYLQKIHNNRNKIPCMYKTFSDFSNIPESKDDCRNKKLERCENQIKIKKIQNTNNGSRTIYYSNNFENEKLHTQDQQVLNHTKSLDNGIIIRKQ